MIESLESRHLLSAASFPNLLGDFSGQLFIVNQPGVETIDIRVDSQRKAHFSGTFVQTDGASGIIVGTLKKRNIVAIKYQSTNLVTNLKGKGTGLFHPSGDKFGAAFVLKIGKQKTPASFEVTRQIF